MAINAQLLEYVRKTGEHIAETGKITGRRFCQRQTAGMTAGTRTDRRGLEYGHALPGIQEAEPSRGRQAGESAADHRKVHVCRQRAGRNGKIDTPRGLAPV